MERRTVAAGNGRNPLQGPIGALRTKLVFQKFYFCTVRNFINPRKRLIGRSVLSNICTPCTFSTTNQNSPCSPVEIIWPEESISILFIFPLQPIRTLHAGRLRYVA